MAQHINDSNWVADCWAKYWTQPFTLADSGYGYSNCTHQNHQEGKWKPIKHSTGCRARGEPMQSLGTFISYLVGFVRSAREESEKDLEMIAAGCPNTFFQLTKQEWDMVQVFKHFKFKSSA
jgi:hypothetical protein